jgi:hypothetical protein
MDKYKYTEVREVLERLVARGFVINSIVGDDDGEWTLDGVITPQDAYDKIMEYCDEATVYVTTGNNRRKYLYFVLGNEPGFALADYTEDDEDIYQVSEEVYELYNQSEAGATAVELHTEVEKCRKAILEATECFTGESGLFEMVSILISQRDNAYNEADHYKKQVDKYKAVV